MERRLHTRHRARTTVYVVMSGRKSRICKAKNLSANGVFVETETSGFAKVNRCIWRLPLTRFSDQDPSPHGHRGARHPRRHGTHDGAIRGR